MKHALDEWLTYAGSHPALREDGWVSWKDYPQVPVYSHSCADGSLVSLTWTYGEIAIKGHFHTDPAQEFLALAEALGGNLQGDDGERYTRTGILHPVE